MTKVPEHAVVITLSQDEALVLDAWLERFNKDTKPEAFEDQAEQRVLWNLAATLEKQLNQPLQKDYSSLLQSARGRIRDKQ